MAKGRREARDLKPGALSKARKAKLFRYAGYTPSLWEDIPWLEKAYQDASWSNWSVNRLGAISAVRRIVNQSPLAQALVNAVRSGVVGDTTPSPTFSGVAKKDRPQLVDLWEKFAMDPTTEGTDDLAGLLRALISSMLIDGRVFGLIRRHEDYPCGVAVLPLERDWLADQDGTGAESKYGGRTGINGVIRRPSGRIDAYAFYGRSTSAVDVIKERSSYRHIMLASAADSDRMISVIPAKQVLDMFSPRTASDFEGGISHMLPALRKLMEIARLDAALVQAMEITALKLGFIEREKDALTPIQMEDEEGEDYQPNPDEFMSNTIEELNRGSKFTQFKAAAPNGDISRYRSEIIMNIATSLGCDFATLSGDLREVNYSSLRHASIMAQENHKVHQKIIARRALVPMLDCLIETAMMRGDISISRASARNALMTEWRQRAFPWVDPEKDIRASTEAIKIGIESPQRLAKQHGVDFAKTIAELKEAKKLFDDAGLPFPPDQPSQPEGAMGEGAKKPKKNGDGKKGRS